MEFDRKINIGLSRCGSLGPMTPCKSLNKMKKVIIIGAPRSGTNMLRDVLCSLPRVGTWPCDEINYIWRYGNAISFSDEFTPDMASDKIRNYIAKQFNRIAQKYNLDTVVEKTCANSLRIGFLKKLFPDAYFIFIYRNGVDASVSAQKRWQAPLDIPYLIKKARYVPPLDLPMYAVKYLRSRLHFVFSGDKKLSTWGPKIKNLDRLVRKLELIEVCGKQWNTCVLKSIQGLAHVPEQQVCRISYEEFVTEPEKNLKIVCEFLKIEASYKQICSAVSTVSAASIGKGKSELSSKEAARLLPQINCGLKALGYF